MKRGREYQYYCCWEEYNVEKKGKGKECHLPYIVEAVRNIKWGKGEWDGNFGEENQDLKKNRGREEYQVVGNFIHPCTNMYLMIVFRE